MRNLKRFLSCVEKISLKNNYLSYVEGNDKIEKLREYIPWIRLADDETDPFTLVMNMRFWDLLKKVSRKSDDVWEVPTDIAGYAKKAYELRFSIETRFNNIDWGGYISRYGVDARDFSYPPAVRNFPMSPGKDSAAKGEAYTFSGNNDVILCLKKELAERDKKISIQEKRIKTLMKQYIVLQNQYNEAVKNTK